MRSGGILASDSLPAKGRTFDQGHRLAMHFYVTKATKNDP